jgi:hypothetical protein
VYDDIRKRELVIGKVADAATEEPVAGRAMDTFVADVRKEREQPKPAPQPVARAPKPAAAPVQAVAALPRPLSPWLIVGAGALVVLILAAIALSRRKAAG